jgi:membrane-bound metal-dependent hydrolase YbcI (DUF457 family)
MADFNTHITAGAIVSGLGATLALTSGLVPATELLTLVSAGVIGSILPDIDLDKGKPLHGLFGALGLTLAFGVVMNLGGLPLWALAGVWLTVFLGTSFWLCHVFMHYTAHRGIWHSILAAAFFAAVTIVTLSAVFGKAPAIAWLGGLFMFGGYIVHLILDEVYAVDWKNWRAKNSLWTAIKPYDHHHPVNSGIMAAAVLGLLLMAPSPQPLVKAVYAAETHQHWAAK